MANLSTRRPKRLVWIMAILANVLLNNKFAFRVIGAVNARTRWIGCVFLAYSSRRPLMAQRRGIRALLDRFAWRPAIAGIFRQGRTFGVTFVVTSSEPELIDVRNADRLRSLAAQLEEIRQLLRADRCAMAGVLPSVLHSRGFSVSTAEAEVAAECVALAIDEVREREGLREAPVLLLGSQGFVGSRVMARVGDCGVYAIDRADNDGRPVLPPELKGARAILVNVTWANVLETYIDQMWAGLVVLNEVYPPPSPSSVRVMLDRGVSVYHLAGVEGFALPSFPDAYAGGVPCCAAQIDQELRIRVLRLT